MDRLRRSDLKTLVERPPTTSVSLYMPLEGPGREVQQNAIRLKNLLSRAEGLLVETGMSWPEAKSFLAPGWALHPDDGFWSVQTLGGLCLLIGPDVHRTYTVPRRFDESVCVNKKFTLAPLVHCLADQTRFFLLAVSKAATRLYEGNRQGLRLLPLNNDIPQSALELFSSTQKDGVDGPEFHASAKVGQSRGGQQQDWETHGHAPIDLDKQLVIDRYLQPIARGIDNLLQQEHAPVVLYAIEYFQPVIRETARHVRFLPEGPVGSPDGLNEKQLFEQAWPTVERWRYEQLRLAAARYGEMRGQGLSAEHVEEVLPAARYARVGELFVRANQPVWGSYDFETDIVEVHPQRQPADADLVDLAIEQTLLNGGVPHVLPSELYPQDAESPLAAIYRW